MRNALTIAEQMLEIAEREGTLRPRVVAHANKAACHFQLGELAASREHGERVLALYDADALRDDPLDRRGLVLSYLAEESLLTGRSAEASRWEAELIAGARDRGVVTDLALAQLQALTCSAIRREPEGLVESSGQLVAFCAEHKLELFGATAQVLAAWTTASTGDLDEGIARLREGLHRAQAIGLLVTRCLLVTLLAEACATAGLLGEALATLDDAFGALREDEVWRPDLLRCRGDLLAQQGDDLDAAEAAYREAIERARAMGALLFELRAATGLARLLQRRGRTSEARAVLEPVYKRFPEPADFRDGREAKALLDALGAGSTT
jgi:adenylate cyclase